MATKTKPAAGARQPSRPTAPREPAWVTSAVRGIVVGTAILVIITFLTSVNDVYVLPKVMVLLLGGLGLVGVTAWGLASSGVTTVPRSRWAWWPVAIVAIMGSTTVLGDMPVRSLFGEYGRNAGLLTFAVAALVYVAVMARFDLSALRVLANGLAAAALIFVAYGLIEAVGGEPFRVPESAEPLSTLGQINFVGGYAGIALAVLLWVALEVRHPVWWRVVGGLGAVGTVVVGAKSSSFQTVGALGAGATVVLVAWALDRWRARLVLGVVGAVVVLGAVIGLAAHDKVETQIREGLDERVLMWQAGGHMVADRPVLGWGPSGFAAEWGTYRPAAHVRFGVFALVDAPHDVPLSMFVMGGFILGLTYLAFVVALAVLLVRGVRRTSGERRLLLGAFGAMWAAYQVQSIVSIDMPTLVLLHFLSAAAIVVLSAEPETRLVAVPAFTGRSVRGRPMVTGTGRALQGLIAVVCLAAAWFSVVRPMMADAAFAAARDARASNDLEKALAKSEDATRLASWVGGYWPVLAGTLAASGDQDRALVVGERTAALNPSAVSYALSEAQLAAAMRRDDLAVKYFDLAARRGPHEPEVFRARANYWLAHEPAKAVPELRRVMELRPSVGDGLLLGETLKELGRSAEARAAFRRVLALDPTNEEAQSQSKEA